MELACSYALQKFSGRKGLLQKFLKEKLDPTEKMAAYLGRVLKIVRSLKDLRKNIFDNQVMAKLIRGLPEKYSTLITDWNYAAVGRKNIPFLFQEQT